MNVIWKPNTAKVRKRPGKISLFFSNLFERSKKYLFWLGIIIPVLVILLFFLGKYISSDKFKIKSIESFGAVLTKEEEIDSIKAEFMGKNIFFVRTSVIEKKIKERGSYISSVFVEKILPDKLEIQIEEKSPSLVYIDFTNAYLTTDDAEVIDVLSQDKEIQLSEEEMSILKGFGDPNGDYVIERIISENPDLQEDSSLPLLEKEKREHDREEFIKSITDEEKRNALNEIQGEILAKVNQIFDSHIEDVSRTNFGNLPKTFIYEAKKYEIGSYIEKERINFFIEVVDFINDLAEFDVSRYLWDSNFRLSVHLSNGKVLYFSTKRDFKLQNEDLILVLNEIRKTGKTYKSIDVGSDKIVVEN